MRNGLTKKRIVDKNGRHTSVWVRAGKKTKKKSNFDKWFKGSKVVDDNGKPLVVYHGTRTPIDFSEFISGSHFGDNEAANSRARVLGFGSNERVLPVYLSIKNPKEVEDVGGYERWKREITSAKRGGYDGLKYKNKYEGKGYSYVIFNANQVKSATGNSGAFDPRSVNINRGTSERSGKIGGGIELINKKLYRKIKRRGQGEGGEVRLTKAEVRTVLRHGVVGFVSAGINSSDPVDAKLTDEQVSARHNELKNQLVDMGFMYEQCKGVYKGDVEDSFMVMVNEASEEETIALGVKYNQDSVLHSNKSNNSYIYTTGENKGKRHRGQGFEELGDSDKGDFWSEIDTPKGKIRFILDFNFSKMTKALMGFIGVKR